MDEPYVCSGKLGANKASIRLLKPYYLFCHLKINSLLQFYGLATSPTRLCDQSIPRRNLYIPMYQYQSGVD